MQIFIMRHGEAEDFSVHAPVEDHERVLTTFGEKECLVMAKWLENNSIKPTEVLVSPFIRAKQSCDIATENIDSPVTVFDGITPSDDAKQVHDFIDGWCAEKLTTHSSDELSLLLVSHMPLVSFLVGDITFYESAPIFATAAIAQIDYDVEDMKGTLVQLISPRDLGLFN